MRAVHVLMAYSYRKQAYILIVLWKKMALNGFVQLESKMRDYPYVHRRYFVIMRHFFRIEGAEWERMGRGKPAQKDSRERNGDT